MAFWLGSVVGFLAKKISDRKKSARCFLSPAEICSRFHESGCNYCEDLHCGDNTSPAKNLARAALGALPLVPPQYPKREELRKALAECGVIAGRDDA